MATQEVAIIKQENIHTIISVAKPNIVNASFAEIEEELWSLLKKANLQRDER